MLAVSWSDGSYAIYDGERGGIISTGRSEVDQHNQDVSFGISVTFAKQICVPQTPRDQQLRSLMLQFVGRLEAGPPTDVRRR
jgi:hypothetical protein